MIYTCTLNPAIDYRMELDRFKEQTLNRATFNKFSAGGKGINVSIVLSHLGVDNLALGFMGGFTGNYLRDYLTTAYQLNVDFTPINDNTRINVKLHIDKKDTEVNAQSPKVSKVEVEALLKKIETLNKGDVLVLAGSSVKSDVDLYESIVKLCHQKEIDFVIDTEKERLLNSLIYKPLLVKPNLFELESLFDETLDTESKIIQAAKKLISKGAQNVIVSLGKEGSLLLNKDQILKAEPITGDVKNTVGAGDSMVAGFVGGMASKLSLKEAYKQAVACGSATAFSYDLGTKNEIETLKEKVKIIEVYDEN